MRENSAFETQDKQIAALEAENLVLRVENEKLEAEVNKLKELATKDELTGAYNRRGIKEEIQRFVETIKSRPEKMRSFGTLILDIDNFKRLNDAYGHSAGDEVLKNIAIICSAQVRDLDRVGRWGGEEFIVILPDCDEKESVIVAERIRLAIKDNVVEYGDEQIRTTVSIGIASYGGKNDFDEIIKLADAALYQAKNAGRNKAVSAAELKK